MGFRDLVQSLTKTAITATIGDLAETCSYNSIVGSHSNATLLATNTPTTKTIQAVFTKKKDSIADVLKVATAARMDQDTNPTEAKASALIAIVSAKQLTDLGVTPKQKDTITRASGAIHTVEAVELDAAGAAYRFTLRLP